MDQMAKQALAAKLQGHMKKASSNIKTAFVSEKGDYKIVLSSDNVKQYFKDEMIGVTKVAEFDDETIEFINSNPSEAAAEMLEGFRSNFNESEHVAKTAANKALDEETAQKITQKQFDDQKTSLHPRTDEYYSNITQKQLPEHGQRPGTYDQITEGQFRDERTTFYGADRTAGDWKQEDRNIVTEGQFEEGVKEYSEVGESDRGQIGSKFDGDLDKQWRMTGEKQLMELLSHHEWTEPLTTTEGPDQLQKQDGELSRITAEVAEKIIKEALNALGRTVLAVGATPDQVSNIIKRLVSHNSKYPVLAHTIACYANCDTIAIDKKVAKARHFGKTANTSIDYSDNLVADVFVRQLAKMSYNPKYIVDSLVALACCDDLPGKISESCEGCMNCGKDETKESNSNVDIFKKVLAGEHKENRVIGSDDDGLYSYQGAISEVNADVKDQEKFATAAAEYSRQQILKSAGKQVDIVPQSLDVDEEKGQFEIVFADSSRNSLTARAEARRKLAKQAQMGGAGGMPPAAGPEMGNPAPPAGGADMGAPPPGEALSQEPPMEEGLGEEGATGEPQPPGAVCPACGNTDVDLDNGELRCNNCGAEGTVAVKIDMKKWPETIQENELEDEEGFGLGAEEEGMGLEEPGAGEGAGLGGEGEGTTLPNVPVGASVKVRDILNKIASKPARTVIATTLRVTPRMLETLKKQKIQLGSVCPNCGGHNTDLAKSASKTQDGICWSCLQEYGFRVVAAKGRKNNVHAQYVWSPKKEETECKGCNRLKEAFNTSLRNYGITREQFDNIKSITEQGDLVIKMAKAGSLDLSSAMAEKLPVKKIAASARWSGSEKFDKFPSASCRERLSRRFGENATAMSGPCEGKKLAECVCKQLETLGIYTDGLAAKVASSQASKDPMINSPMKTCISMFVKSDYDYDNACIACDGLRAAHADTEDLVIEAIAQINPYAKPMPSAAPTDGMKSKKMKPMEAPGMGSPKPAPKPMGMGSPAPKPMGMGAPKPMGNPMPAPMEMGSPSPMEEDPMGADPMDDPISNATEIGGDLGSEMGDEMGDEFGGGMGDEMGDEFDMGMEGFGDEGFGDEGLDAGMGGNVVTVELPQEAVDAFQVLFDALQGQLDMGGGMEEMEGGMGDEVLDVGDITDGTVDEGPGMDETFEHEEGESPEFESGEESEESEGFGGSEESDESEESDGGIPGLSDDDEVPGGFGESEESEDDSDGEDKSMLHKKTKKDCGDGKPCGSPMKEKPSSGKPMPVAESDSVTKEAQLDDLLFSMKTGTLKNTQSALDNLFTGIIRQATLNKEAAEKNDVKKVEYKDGGKGSKVKVTPAQESSDVKFKDGGKIGHEEAFSKGVNTKPDIPRGKATIGDEDSDLTISETGDLPTVPHGSPAMAGEKHYRPEKGNVVDGNQGSQTTASANKPTKTSSKGDKNMKTASVWTVSSGHQYYDALKKKANAGERVVKLQDNKIYDMIQDQNGNFVLIAQNSSKNIKESQTVSPKKVDSLEKDPDINQSSGPGKGKVKEDKTHSLAVTEQKPSEGMNSPDVPEAPNSGQLTREHTFDNKLDGPEIPAGGGMNSEYDQNEKNKPEKLDQMLGKQNDIAAMASHDEAVKVAGQMLKANLITIDELPNKVNELSKATLGTLRDYENMLRKASVEKGMQKEASSDAVETAFVQKTAGTEPKETLKNDIQSLFRLDGRNRDHERYKNEQGNLRLFH